MYDLISDNDYATLPEEAGLKFARIEGICRRNLNEMSHNSDDAHFVTQLQLQYMAIVAATAEQLGIEGVEYPEYADRPQDELGRFMRLAAAKVAKARLNSATDAYSVRLAAKTRAQIEREIQNLRNAIDGSDLSPYKKSALNTKLDELSAELRNTRASFGRVMAVLAGVVATAGGAVALAADAPEAIANIAGLLGADKVAEDAEVSRLGAPLKPLAIPAPRYRPTPDDDEIPF